MTKYRVTFSSGNGSEIIIDALRMEISEGGVVRFYGDPCYLIVAFSPWKWASIERIEP